MCAFGRSNQPVVILDSTGRAYSVPSHNLPSARGQGEPVTGRLNPPSGATFEGMMMGAEEQLFLLASDAGYGFVAKLADLQSKNRSGKAALSLPKGARVLPPAPVAAVPGSHVAAVTTEGRLLVFPLEELPQLARGKGNKIIGIPPARVQSRDEFVVAVQVVSEQQSLVVYAGKRHIKLKFSELEHYRGERGRRGNKLPRGFQKVDAMSLD